MGLAFLDVLCCGLGSAVFLLLVIRHGPSPTAADDLLVATSVARTETEIAVADERIAELRSAIATVADVIRSGVLSLQAVAGLSNQQKSQAQDALASLGSEQRRLDAEAARLADALARSQAPPTTPATPRQHLTGLSVEDDRVAVFLDSSASMLDSSLIEILRLRVSSNNLKRAAEKWTTARNAAKWLYEQVPEGGRYRLFHYAEDIHEVPGGKLPAGPVGWTKKPPNAPRSGQGDAVERGLAGLVPDGATDLRQVFETAARLNPAPIQVVLITDGLPTLPGATPLQRLKHCKRPRRNTTPLITAQCRASIFADAVAVARRALPNSRIDIILLPLQGDANAVGSYWDLALVTGGRLLAPATGWLGT